MNFELVVESIEKLYLSRDPAQISSIQHSLQQLQKSPDGPELAELLLRHPLKNCQFFGALTYTVVINSQRNIDHNLHFFLSTANKTIHHILHYGSNSNGLQMVLRKLLSNLSLLFLIGSVLLSRPMHVILLALVDFASNTTTNATDLQVIDYIGIATEKFQLSPSLKLQLLSQLPPQYLPVVLEFSTILVDDICKNECPPSIHGLIFADSFQITSDLYHSILPNFMFQPLDDMALTCINSWVTYIGYAEDNSTIRYKNEVSSFLHYLMSHFTLNLPSLLDSIPHIDLALKATTEIIELAPRLLDLDLKNYLNLIIFDENLFGSAYLTFLLKDIDTYLDEVGTLVTLIIASLRRDMLHFARTLANPETGHICNLLTQLTAFPGIPVHEETILDQLISFWEDLANVFIDDDGEVPFDDLYPKEGNRDYHTQLFTKVVGIYWSKIRIPEDGDVFASVKLEFMQYRANVADFFIVVYSLLKQPFYQSLCESLVLGLNGIGSERTSGSQSLDLENTLYLIYKITDDVSYLESLADNLVPCLDLIFAADFTSRIRSVSQEKTILQVFTSTAIHFLASVQFYFKSPLVQGFRHLGGVLDFLFNILLSPSPQLSLNASRTILKTCQENRDNLVEFLPTLEPLLVEMLRNHQIDHLIRQRMFNAYASIAHSIRDPIRFSDILQKLLAAILDRSSEVVTRKEEFSTVEDRDDYILSMVSCVSEIGKACQVPDELDNFYSSNDQIEAVDQFWKEDPLKIRDSILDIVHAFLFDDKFHLSQGNLLIIEKCCSILKSGLGEEISGPFVFSTDIILSYILQKIDGSDVSSVTLLYGLMESLIICRQNEICRNPEQYQMLIKLVLSDRIETIKQDPDLTQSVLSLLTTILEKKPILLVQSPVYTDALLFSLEVLGAKELVVIKTVTKFWLTLLALKRGTAQDIEVTRNLLTNTPFGQHLVVNLFSSFLSGPRSHLDHYYQVFRNLITKYLPMAKGWITTAFTLPQIVDYLKVNAKLVEIFITKLMMTRGQRAANDVLKKFWLEANGMIDYNTRAA